MDNVRNISSSPHLVPLRTLLVDSADHKLIFQSTRRRLVVILQKVLIITSQHSKVMGHRKHIAAREKDQGSESDLIRGSRAFQVATHLVGVVESTARSSGVLSRTCDIIIISLGVLGFPLYRRTDDNRVEVRVILCNLDAPPGLHQPYDNIAENVQLRHGWHRSMSGNVGTCVIVSSYSRAFSSYFLQYNVQVSGQRQFRLVDVL